jgi:hypothetical protein
MKLPWKKKLTEEEKLEKAVLETKYLSNLLEAIAQYPKDFKAREIALLLSLLWSFLTLIAIFLWS